MLRTSVACLLLAVYSVSAVTEYIALGKGSAGTSGGGGAPTPDLAWVKMTYETNAKLVGDVSVESAGNDENVPEFLRHLVLSSSFSLTAKYYEEKLYAYHNFGNVPTDQGCCADTLRIYSADGNEDIDTTFVNALFPNATDDFAYTTHTFDLAEINGATTALFLVQYKEPALKSGRLDAIVAYDLDSKQIVPTADGEQYFSLYDNVGTLSTLSSDSVFQIQYYLSDEENDETELHHANGITRVTLQDGTVVLGLTHKAQSGAVIIADPYTYTKSAGGGEILQRFGNPPSKPHFGLNTHIFGLDVEDWKGQWKGTHNLRYQSYDELGRETFTMFVNSDGSNKSAVYEFDIKLVRQAELTDEVDDTVFHTDYKYAEINQFVTDHQGGARPIGSYSSIEDGLWVIASGDAGLGVGVLDIASDTSMFSTISSVDVYDPFVYFVLEEEEGKV